MRTSQKEQIRRDLESRDARTRERGVAALPKGRASIRAVTRFLDDADAFVRNAALERLLEWDAKHSLTIVLPKLRDPFDIARITALECVAYWGRSAHRRFVEPLLGDSSPSVRAYAAWALAELGSDNLLPKLQARLGCERHPVPRAALHEALFRLTGDDRHLEALVRASLLRIIEQLALQPGPSAIVSMSRRARELSRPCATLRDATGAWQFDRPPRKCCRDRITWAAQQVLQPASRKRAAAQKARAGKAARG